MQKIQYIFLIIIGLSLFFFPNNITNSNNKSSYTDKTMYNLYSEREKTICDDYKYKKDGSGGKIRFLTNTNEDYEEINNQEYNFKKIQNTHRNYMNNIYKCALLSIQEKSLELIKKDLINKNKNLANKVSNKISSKMHRIQMSFSRFNCKKNNSYDLQKLNVLHQASYQTCKYVIYLEYLKEYNNKLSNLTNNDKNSYTNSELIELQRNEILEIEKEIEHTYKVFPLAYHAYTEYENNITTHFLLELLREDYIVFKEKLHKVLNPINQVVYKISNAMRK